MNSSFVNAFKSNPFLGILRGIEHSQVAGVAQASFDAGLGFIEITMNTPGAPELIRAMCRVGKPLDLVVGAGTVRSLTDLNAAIAAGAQFIVSPAFQPQVAEECLRHEIPYLPGALTPTEIQSAWDFGATLIKVFPAMAMGGPAYIKELRGPYQDIPLFACGGVSPDNVAEYFRAGIDGVAFGASIYRSDWLKNGQWSEVTKAILALRNARG